MYMAHCHQPGGCNLSLIKFFSSLFLKIAQVLASSNGSYFFSAFEASWVYCCDRACFASPSLDLDVPFLCLLFHSLREFVYVYWNMMFSELSIMNITLWSVLTLKHKYLFLLSVKLSKWHYYRILAKLQIRIPVAASFSNNLQEEKVGFMGTRRYSE